MNFEARLYPNTDDVTAKVMDGEAIIINFSNGVYYSLDKVGGFIWEMIEKNHNALEIVEALQLRYDTTYEQIQADLETLISELVKENLIKENVIEESCERMLPTSGQPKLPYEFSQLNVYRDMGQLLALDPPMPGLKDMAWKETES
jgi:hypothetical protein